MQDYNTIMGVIQMRFNQCSYRVIQSRSHLSSSIINLIAKRFKECQLSLDELKKLEPKQGRNYSFHNLTCEMGNMLYFFNFFNNTSTLTPLNKSLAFEVVVFSSNTDITYSSSVT